MPGTSIRWLVAALALGAMAAPACAFQESTVGSAPGKPAAGANGAPTLDLSIPDTGVKKGPGTEVRIPGVGTLGVLPKLDFGLELLYGSGNEPAGAGRLPDNRGDPEGTQIRGSIKYRF